MFTVYHSENVISFQRNTFYKVSHENVKIKIKIKLTTILYFSSNGGGVEKRAKGKEQGRRKSDRAQCCTCVVEDHQLRAVHVDDHRLSAVHTM